MSLKRDGMKKEAAPGALYISQGFQYYYFCHPSCHLPHKTVRRVNSIIAVMWYKGNCTHISHSAQEKGPGNQRAFLRTAWLPVAAHDDQACVLWF